MMIFFHNDDDDDDIGHDKEIFDSFWKPEFRCNTHHRSLSDPEGQRRCQHTSIRPEIDQGYYGTSSSTEEPKEHIYAQWNDMF